MDDLTDTEFYSMYIRIDNVVGLWGAYTEAAIKKRIQRKLDEHPSQLTPNWRIFLRHVKHSFARRCIDEAIANPKGLVALGMRYGVLTAKKILNKRALERLEILHKRVKERKQKRRKKR